MIALSIALLLLRGDSMVETVEGELPIVLTAPHGGTDDIPGADKRENNGTRKFVTVTDTRTDALSRATAEELEKQTGKKPWVVIAKFSRKYLDPNRPIEDATDSDAGREQYKFYHEAIRHAVDAIRTKFGKGLLIDVHGQGSAPTSVFRGTKNLETVTALPEDQLSGPSSLLAVLEHQGIHVSPGTMNPRDKENPKLDGGYTVQTYGTNNPDGIFAFQLEFGSTYREKSAIPDTAKALATALKSHYEAFLKAH